MILYNTTQNTEALYDKVFQKINAETLTIISGFYSLSTCEDLISISSYYKNIEVIIGMKNSGINEFDYNKMSDITKKCPNINFYLAKNVHSKIYVWHNSFNIVECYLGSANFSTVLQGHLEREILYKSDNRSISDYIKTIYKKKEPIKINGNESENVKKDIKQYQLSLLSSVSGNSKNIIGIKTENNKPHGGAAINWGYSKGLPALNDAYIPISKYFIRSNPNLIPYKSIESKNIPYDAIWDDNTSMKILFEGNNDNINGQDYAKQISTYKNKHLIGDYIRKRISEKINIDLLHTEEEIQLRTAYNKDFPRKDDKVNFPFKHYCIQHNKLDLYNSIKSKFITKEYLDQYGRSDISIIKLDDNLNYSSRYYLDFSV